MELKGQNQIRTIVGWSKIDFIQNIICIASHSLHWHMVLCREPMVPTVPVQHRLLGITMQLHILLGMKAGDIALHRIVAFAL